jgi:phosphoserine phosphatase RsbU/P
MSPRMKRRKKNKQPTSPNLLRLFLALWIVASLGYWIAGIADMWETHVHWDQRVNIPFAFDSDSRIVKHQGLSPEARSAGLGAGDWIDQLNGAPYSGLAQWSTILSDSHPGDILDVDVIRANGSHATDTITLVRPSYIYGRLSPMWAFWKDFLLAGLLTIVCLVTGYWVVLSRPADRNAWLTLVLLTFPSVVFVNAGLASGVSLFLREFWYETLQLAGAPALLLFGIWFPERSRVDARVPWIKELLFAIFGIAVCFLYPSIFVEHYGGGDGPFLTHASDLASKVINAFNLLCVILYLVLTLDKLRSASTEDARRRLRVLTTGMSIGMGSLLLVFVFLPDLPPAWRITGNTTAGYWIRTAGAFLFMIAPLTLAYVVVV